MKWELKDWGFLFDLKKEIPVLIAHAVGGFVTDLCQKAGVEEREILEEGVFAVHPGGPKILDYVQERLKVKPERLFLSRRC